MKVLYEVRDKVAYITINRPEVMNAMDSETFQLLSKAWCDVRDNPDVWVAIVTGAGKKAFTAGIDLKTTIPSQPACYVRRGFPVFLAYSDYSLLYSPINSPWASTCPFMAFSTVFLSDLEERSKNASRAYTLKKYR